jgi:hypothetical protein
VARKPNTNSPEPIVTECSAVAPAPSASRTARFREGVASKQRETAAISSIRSEPDRGGRQIVVPSPWRCTSLGRCPA